MALEVRDKLFLFARKLTLTTFVETILQRIFSRKPTFPYLIRALF